MIKLVKFIIGSVLLATLGYFLFFVPLGTHTLYQHLRNISNTDEAKELGDGLKQKANLVTTNVVDSVPELKAVDEKVDAVKTAVSSHTTQKLAHKNVESVSKEDVSPTSIASSRKKPAEVSDDDRAALDKLLKSKLK